MATQQPEALRVAAWLITAPQKTTIGDMLFAGRELRRQHARIVELEAKLAAAPQAVQAAVPDADEVSAQARKGQEIDEAYAHKLALELECMLIDPTTYWDSAAKLLDEYKAAWNEINPSPPPFGSDFPVPPERKAIYAAMKDRRSAIAAQAAKQGENP